MLGFGLGSYNDCLAGGGGGGYSTLPAWRKEKLLTISSFQASLCFPFPPAKQGRVTHPLVLPSQ